MDRTSPVSVILVDDEVSFVTVLAKRLALRGLDSLATTSGPEAIQALRSRDFDVAVLDLNLPAANGSAPRGLQGLVLAQDTGAAIRGHRLDLYLGGGETAARLEAGMRASAGLHLLGSKNALRPNVYTRGQ